MKRNFMMILAAAVAMLGVWSCQKEKESPVSGNPSKISVSVTGEIGNLVESDAKASIGIVTRLSWTAGDTVFVYDGEKYLGDLTVSLNKAKDSRYAYLSGEIESQVSGNVLTCVYAKGIKTAPEVEDDKVKFSMEKQDPQDTPFVVYGTIDYDPGQTSITNKLVNFNFATAVVLVNCVGLATDGGDVIQAELSGINKNCVLSLSGTAAPEVVEDTEVGTITTSGDFTKLSGNGKLYYQIGVPVSPQVYPKKDPETQRKLTVTQETEKGEKTRSTNFTSSNFDAGGFANVAYKLEEYTPPTPQSDGSLPGVFTINANGDQVKFSQGNLQYQASTNTWRFAPNQYDYIGDGGTNCGNVGYGDNTKIDDGYDGWIDLFGWGTSGNGENRNTNECYQPWSSSTTYSLYDIKGVSDTSLSVDKKTDWGYNSIRVYDGDSYSEEKPVKGWRTLKGAEWNYIIGTSTTTSFRSGLRFIQCYLKVDENVTYGLLMFPDGWQVSDWPNGPAETSYNNSGSSGYDNAPPTLDITNVFMTLQGKGAVFLPQTGYRSGTGLDTYFRCHYWAADTEGRSSTYNVMHTYNFVLSSYNKSTQRKNLGKAVRLVTDVPSN